MKTVSEVIDGDTIVLSTGEAVRLLGINAPETGKCFASEVKQELEHLVLDKAITITEEQRDSYRRRMGLMYVDTTLVNTLLIEK